MLSNQERAAELHEEVAAHILFDGTPSQAINAPTVIVALIMFAGIAWCRVALHAPQFLLVGPVVLVVGLVFLSFLKTATTIYTIDEERIRIRRGIFTRKLVSLELFRVQDVTLIQKWWHRILHIGTVVIDSSDLISPRLSLRGMSRAEDLRNNLNKAAITLRDAKGIREINFGKV